jgi:hypothetical protein
MAVQLQGKPALPHQALSRLQESAVMESSRRVTSIFIAVALLALAVLALSVDRQKDRKIDVATKQSNSNAATADKSPVQTNPAER